MRAEGFQNGPHIGGELTDLEKEVLTVPFICAYGIGRNPSGSKPKRGYRLYDSVLNLFNYRTGLIDPELAWRRLRDYTDIAHVEGKLKKALGLSSADTFKLPSGGGILLSGPTLGKDVPIQAWADGYRMTFSWILDLYAWAMAAEAIDEDGDISGILLIDEIEQHLHPSMQTGIMDRIGALLPKMQIIATTHSPLTALGCKPGELVLLRREEDHVVADTNLPNFSGFSVEDLLSDSAFFDTAPYHPEVNQKLERYHKLLAIPPGERSQAQTATLTDLAVGLRASQYIAHQNDPLIKEIKDLKSKMGLA